MPRPEPHCGTPEAVFWQRISQTLTKKGQPRARNRHPGRCTICDRPIPAGAGCIEKNDRTGQWNVYC